MHITAFNYAGKCPASNSSLTMVRVNLKSGNCYFAQGKLEVQIHTKDKQTVIYDCVVN